MGAENTHVDAKLIQQLAVRLASIEAKLAESRAENKQIAMQAQGFMRAERTAKARCHELQGILQEIALGTVEGRDQLSTKEIHLLATKALLL